MYKSGGGYVIHLGNVEGRVTSEQVNRPSGLQKKSNGSGRENWGFLFSSEETLKKPFVAITGPKSVQSNGVKNKLCCN
ncbi:hypothetical protein OUZ56_000621 [Daphnia magna]|uniref:Uncharacterized protein n=1 Tax=Daphnia magna TaxID=35525 RepID=A0ABR0A085_9CRUS|nr:hypothetical protein OUZ56_000621 [Daphnia magna]